MKKLHTYNLAAQALYTMLFMALTVAPAYATSTPSTAPVAKTSPVGVVSNAPINLNSTRPQTVQRVRTAPDTTSAAAHNQRLQKQQARQATTTKIKSPFPAGFSGGFDTVTPVTPEQAAAQKPVKPYVPPRPATSSVDETKQNQANASGQAPSTPYTAINNSGGARGSASSGAKTAPYTAPSAYNGLSRR